MIKEKIFNYFKKNIRGMILLLCVFLSGVLFLLSEYRNKEISSRINSKVAGLQRAMDAAFESKEDMLVALVKEYEVRSDIVSAIKRHQTVGWEETAMDDILSHFEVDAVSVYDADGVPLYTSFADAEHRYQIKRYTETELADFFDTKDNVIDYFLSDNELVKAAGIAVRGDDDNKVGYIFVYRLWDKDFLADLNDLLDAVAELKTDTAVYEKTAFIDKGYVYVVRPVFSFDHRHIADVLIHTKVPSADILSASVDDSLINILIIIVFIGLFMSPFDKRIISTIDHFREHAVLVNSLKRRDNILQAVRRSVDYLLPSDRWDEKAEELLRVMAEGAGVDTAYIFIRDIAGNSQELSVVHLWQQHKTARGINNIDFFSFFSDPQKSLLWRELLSQNQVITQETHIIDESTKEELDKCLIRSFICVPVFSSIRWEGVIIFIDSRHEKEWTQIEIEALRAAAGAVSSAIQRQKTQDQLAVSEKRYRAIVEDQTELICRYLPDMTVTFVNNAFLRYFDRSYEDTVGHTLDIEMFNVDAGFIQRQRMALDTDRQSVTYEMRVQRKEGDYAWLLWTDRVIFDHKGKPAEYQSVALDVTLRKKAEERLLETAKIRSEFTSMVSHELRTPLTALKESIGIINDGSAGPLTEEQKHFADMAYRSVARLTRLISDVLDFQKLESGKMRLVFKCQSIVPLIEEICRSMKLVADRSGVKLYSSYSGTLTDASFDRDRIEQVILNLVNNAVKFTYKGEIEISAVGEADFIRISVRDTGSGISEENLSKVFQPFEQMGTPQQNSGGTGLGLSICKQIVEKHGGRIWVESRDGQCSVFYFTLPYKISDI